MQCRCLDCEYAQCLVFTTWPVPAWPAGAASTGSLVPLAKYETQTDDSGQAKSEKYSNYILGFVILDIKTVTRPNSLSETSSRVR